MEPGSAGLKGGKDGVNQQGIDNFEKKLQDQTNELNKLDPNDFEEDKAYIILLYFVHSIKYHCMKKHTFVRIVYIDFHLTIYVV